MMWYRTREIDKRAAVLRDDLEPVITGLGFALVELDVYRGKRAAAQVRVVVTRPPPGEWPETAGPPGGKIPAGSGIGTEELAALHRAILPRLELVLGEAREGAGVYVEVSSPGTDRVIKEGAEFRHFTGRGVLCYISGESAWKAGVLRGSDPEKILLETGEGLLELPYGAIGKAKLDDRRV
ncbi:MAG: ribosome assembly cofactor RimP [Treponema sp.]|jgi:ribosome maturation factor RimP|nr:ribosome assembly cofactor RimP [Treponema sp.]